jgi:hypothetical protein
MDFLQSMLKTGGKNRPQGLASEGHSCQAQTRKNHRETEQGKGFDINKKQLFILTNILRLPGKRNMNESKLAALAGGTVSFLAEFTTGKANPLQRVMESIAAALEMLLLEIIALNYSEKNR